MASSVRPAECSLCGVVFQYKISSRRVGSEILCQDCRISRRERTCLECGGSFVAAGTPIRCSSCQSAVVRFCRDCGQQTLSGKRAFCYECEPINSASVRHHIPVAQLRKMLADQENLCSICGLPEVRTTRGRLWLLSVDHDHQCCPGQSSCGKCIRGLICSNCNCGIGYFQDNVATMLSAVSYLHGYVSVGQPSDHREGGAQAGKDVPYAASVQANPLRGNN